MPRKDLEETYDFLVRALKKDHPKLGYLHLTQPRIAGIIDKKAEVGENLDFLVHTTAVLCILRRSFPADLLLVVLQLNIWAPLPIILAGGYKADQALAEAEKYTNAIIAFGRHFISNVSEARRRRPSHFADTPAFQPDLPMRIKNGLPFTPYNRKTFYTPEAAEG